MDHGLLAMTNLGAHTPLLASDFPTTTTPSATHERPLHASKVYPTPNPEKGNHYLKRKCRR